MQTIRHFIDLKDIPALSLSRILESAVAMKAQRNLGAEGPRPLAGRNIVMVFEQPSLRTRLSFDVAIRELGGAPLMVTGAEIELGQREALGDTARVMSRYASGVMIRMLNHAALKEFAAHATVPVINGLTKFSHPCQVLADIMTFEERLGSIRNRTIAWVGDANNVLGSWMEAAAKFGFTLRIATPSELAPDPARGTGGDIVLLRDPSEAVKDADCVITDAWVSMGDTDTERRHALLQPYQVNAQLMAKAASHAIFMHCLPAHRGEEVTDEVIDGSQSAVLDEAENRMHVQKGILAWVFQVID